jgi:four helix bundle protein
MTTPSEPFAARAFRLACALIRLDMELRRSGRVPQHIARQLLAAGTAIAANLEEAKAGQSRRDVAAKFAIALKEARETAYWLRLISATDLADPHQLAAVTRETSELVAILTVSLRRLRGQETRVPLTPETGSDE